MYKIVLVFTCVVYCSNSQLRISNGKDSKENEFPFMVSVRNRYGKHFCGGTILNENYILSAAHCFCDGDSRSEPFSIQYGSIYISEDHNRSIDIINVTCHKDFKPRGKIFDVAVLKLANRLPNGTWSAVQLSKNFIVTSWPLFCQKGTVAGWGSLTHGGPYSRILQKLNVRIYPDILCVMTDHYICTGQWYAGICPGDSGSPLLVNGVQVGIASFITGKKCGVPSILAPDVYTRVTVYYDWIMSEAIEI